MPQKPGTPDPTIEEVFAAPGASGGRISVTISEVLRWLQLRLPEAIERVNAEGIAKLDKIENFQLARETIEGGKTPAILVGASVNIEERAPQRNAVYPTIVVYAICKRTDGRESVLKMWDLAELVRLVMKPAQGHWFLPDGRRVWNQCVPGSMSQIPPRWPEYSGIACEFVADQRGVDLWTPATDSTDIWAR